MFGLGVCGFLVARAVGLGNNSIWVALVLSTVGFALSIMITLRMGRQYEQIKPAEESSSKATE